MTHDLTIRVAVLLDAVVYYRRRLAQATADHRAAPTEETVAQIERFEDRLAACERALRPSDAASSPRPRAALAVPQTFPSIVLH